MSTEQTAEEKVADMIFGPEETIEAQQEPVVEGEEAEPVEEEVELSEEEEAEAEKLAEDMPEMFEVTVGDTVYEVPGEVRDQLEKANDYTQKTQGVKREWETAQIKMGELKAHEATYQFAQSIQEETLRTQVLDRDIEAYKTYMKDNVDTLEYKDLEKLRMQIGEMEAEKGQIIADLQTRYDEHQQAQEQTKQELLNKSTDVLRQKVPNWGDDTDKALKEYAVTAGYTEAEYDALVDPRLKETLWKAQQYDNAKQGSEKAVNKVTVAPKMQSRKTMPKATGDKLNLRKKLKSNRSNADKADALGHHIAERFGM